jgi:hypothetical protein
MVLSSAGSRREADQQDGKGRHFGAVKKARAEGRALPRRGEILHMKPRRRGKWVGGDLDRRLCGALNGVSALNAALIEKLPEESRKAQAELASRLAAVTRTKAEREILALRRCP